MKKILFIILLCIPIARLHAQTYCWNTIHTVTTDPNSPNNNSGNTFDWTLDNTVNWFYDFNLSHPIHLPYFCNGSQSTSIDDGCSNENVGYYAMIRSEEHT